MDQRQALAKPRIRVITNRRSRRLLPRIGVVTQQEQVAEVAPKPKRPWNVTLVAIVGIILSAFGLFSGIAEAAFSGNVTEQTTSGQSKSVLLVLGIVFSLIALASIILWFGFLRGNRVIRIILTVFVVLHMVVSVIAIVAIDATTNRISFSAVIVVEIVILLLMFVGQRTKDFFAKRPE